KAQDPWQTALVKSEWPDAQPPAALGRLRVALSAAMTRPANRASPPVAVPHVLRVEPTVASAWHPVATPAAATETSADHLVVPLAGLVLLHPYLARLLQGLQLHSGQPGEALAPAVLPRALALLHALACDTAAAAALELDLPFVKLLLGLPPTQGLDLPPAQLDEADTAEVQALLQAVRQHWPALRSTSVQALRISFLQRRGLLRRAADGQGWQLQVQSEAFDLLLASLPWSLSWVKLPWMPEPLAVDWQAPS
ncbi:MAG: contractile injection system tape measure protein, partial [Rubrivivax sp.]|nr:contractile injection system tape measure protein [Rubrivivax sp.]